MPVALYCLESQDRGLLQLQEEMEPLPACWHRKQGMNTHPLPFPTKAASFLLSILQHCQKSCTFSVALMEMGWHGKESLTRILIQDGCLHGKITEVIEFFQRSSRENIATVFRAHFFPHVLVSQTLVSIVIWSVPMPVASGPLVELEAQWPATGSRAWSTFQARSDTYTVSDWA